MLLKSLLKLGVPSIDSINCKKLVGMGTDGASSNIPAAGLKGIFEGKTVGYFGCGIWLIDWSYL